MDAIQTIYIALFGRPADPLGLDYFVDLTNDGADLSAIGDLANQAEYQDRFVGMNGQQIITSIYQSLFGRNPEQAGLEYFLGELNSGRQNINTIAINIAHGAQGDDLATLNNKIAAASAFTAAIDTADELAAYVGDAAADKGRAFLSPITADKKTIPSAAATADAIADLVNTPGDTFAFTGQAGEALVGTAGDDTFTGVVGKDETIKTGATADGKGGTDTANIYIDATLLNKVSASDILPTGSELKNIEIINLISSSTAGNYTGTVDASQFSSATQIWQDGVHKSINKLGAGVTAGFRGDTSSSNATVTFTKDSGSIALDGIQSGKTLTVAGSGSDDVSSLTVSGSVKAAGSNPGEITIDAAGGAAVENLVVNFTNNVELDGSVIGSDLVSFDASGSKGGVTVDLTSAINLETAKFGAGNDVVDIDQNDASLVVDLGAGNDDLYLDASGGDAGVTIEITLGSGSDYVYIDNLENVQVASSSKFLNELVTITDFVLSDDTIDAGFGGGLSTQNIVNGAFSASDSLFEAIGKIAAVMDDYYAQFIYNGDLYIYNDETGNNTFDSGDGLIKLAGVDALLTVGDNLIV